MDGERKINLCEGVPLNSEKPSDLGLHINTTFSVASSKKIKLLFVLNFLLSVICMAISCSIAFYYWNEMISMRRQLDGLKDHMIQNLSHDKQSEFVAPPRPVAEARRARMETYSDDPAQKTRKYYVENFGDDMLLVDSKKKHSNKDIDSALDLPFQNKELLIAQFNGARHELNLGKESLIGPWVRDTQVSSKSSYDKIVLINDTYVTVKEEGLYLIYAQVVYLTKVPTVFYIWAVHHDAERLLAVCASGDDSSGRTPAKSQISCSAQAFARLQPGDTINLAQRDPNRTVWLRPGYSFFGLIKLS
ncbi:uncharacterized protein LOC115441466 isoform X2 [Manduca sexta]|uniref:uncharacterized protein LOC115441466 isoform X2 n=1 Tax=Manduca sexta TaxID=7130 RepID=UPI001183FFEB|nr:uncharacterized protein LOC115441466 isoform X2 [Manduca sexta]